MARRRAAGPRFRLDPVTGRPVEAPAWRAQRREDIGNARATGGRKHVRQTKRLYRRARRGRLDPSVAANLNAPSEPQAVTDPGGSTINVFMPQDQGGGGGGQYQPNAFVPQERQVTDRTKINLADQVGYL